MITKKDVFYKISKFRGLFNDIINSKDTVISDLNELESYENIVLPCDVIDLRDILEDNVITSNNFVCFFSFSFARKYLYKYPIFIILQKKQLVYEKDYYNAVTVCNTSTVDIEDAILRIVINEPTSKKVFDTVRNINKDVNANYEILKSNSIPSLSRQNNKLSNDGNKMTKTAQNAVNLTDVESKIFNFLVDFKKKANTNIDFRVVGGWVRDKLLQQPSDDIDIAVNGSGKNIVKQIYDFAKDNNIDFVSKPISISLDKQSIPEERDGETDELQVGGINIYGMKIEFIPMRKEVYDNESRTPKVEMTNNPSDDSLRRDLTINSLYYNLETKNVEDYTGGLNDLLTNKVLRTPKDAYSIFMEDPLRILRSLRFKSRYPNFKLDEDIIKAMKDENIHQAYAKKVATERAGPELIKIMQSENPTEALRLLFETDIYHQVFKLPEIADIHEDGIHMDQKTEYHEHNLLNHTLKTIHNLNSMMLDNNEDKSMRGLLNLSALFHDFGKMDKSIPTEHPKRPGQMQYIKHEKVSQKMADAIMKSIGIGKDDREIVNSVIYNHMSPHLSSNWGKKGKGNFLRKTKINYNGKKIDLWKYVVYHAKADSLASRQDEDISKYNDLEKDLQSFYDSPTGQFQQPVLNGNEIMGLFPELDAKTGYIKDVMEFLIEKQDNGEIPLEFVNETDENIKSNKLNESKEMAKQKILEIKDEIIRNYGQSGNWYSKQKEAQTLKQIKKDDKGITYGPDKSKIPFSVGDKIKDRRKSGLLPQSYGVIKYIGNNKMIVEWFNKKNKKYNKETYSLGDTVSLFQIIGDA